MPSTVTVPVVGRATSFTVYWKTGDFLSPPPGDDDTEGLVTGRTARQQIEGHTWSGATQTGPVERLLDVDGDATGARSDGPCTERRR